MIIIFVGAVLDEQDSTGKTALLISTGEGRERTTEYLIKNGCDIHKRDKLGQSALYLAVASSNVSISSSENIRKLLRAGKSQETYKALVVWDTLNLEIFISSPFKIFKLHVKYLTV